MGTAATVGPARAARVQLIFLQTVRNTFLKLKQKIKVEVLCQPTLFLCTVRPIPITYEVNKVLRHQSLTIHTDLPSTKVLREQLCKVHILSMVNPIVLICTMLAPI